MRCLQTSQIISQILEIKFEVFDELREYYCPVEHNRAIFLKNKFYLFPNFKWFTKESWTIEPESNDTLFKRANKILQMLPEKSILISHCDWISNFINMTTNENSCIVPFAGLTHIKNNKVTHLEL